MPAVPQGCEAGAQEVAAGGKAVTRLNIRYPAPGTMVRFVGGDAAFANAEEIIQGQTMSEAMFIGGQYWLRVNVPGAPDDVLVPMENLRL